MAQTTTALRIYPTYLSTLSTKDFAKKKKITMVTFHRILWHGYVIFSHPLTSTSL
jgi:hypothetical protein